MSTVVTSSQGSAPRIVFLEGKYEIVVEKERVGMELKLYIELLKWLFEEKFEKLNQRVLTKCIVDTIKEQLPNIKFYCLRANLKSYGELCTSEVANVTYAILKSTNIQLVGVARRRNQTTNQNENITNSTTNPTMMDVSIQNPEDDIDQSDLLETSDLEKDKVIFQDNNDNATSDIDDNITDSSTNLTMMDASIQNPEDDIDQFDLFEMGDLEKDKVIIQYNNDNATSDIDDIDLTMSNENEIAINNI